MGATLSKSYLDDPCKRVKYLKGKDPITQRARDLIQKEGFNKAIIIACTRSDVELVRLFLKKGMTVDEVFFEEDFKSPLILACYGQGPQALQTVELLLSQPEVDINHCSLTGVTALLAAVIGGSLEIVQLLLTQPNINIHCRLVTGENCVVLAALWVHVDIMRLLLEIPELNINLTNRWDSTPLMIAAECMDPGHCEIVQLLLQREDLDSTLRNREGQTAKEIAIHRGVPEIIRMLS